MQRKCPSTPRPNYSIQSNTCIRAGAAAGNLLLDEFHPNGSSWTFQSARTSHASVNEKLTGPTNNFSRFFSGRGSPSLIANRQILRIVDISCMPGPSSGRSIFLELLPIRPTSIVSRSMHGQSCSHGTHQNLWALSHKFFRLDRNSKRRF